jgi:hypothetical protein
MNRIHKCIEAFFPTTTLLGSSFAGGVGINDCILNATTAANEYIGQVQNNQQRRSQSPLEPALQSQ